MLSAFVALGGVAVGQNTGGDKAADSGKKASKSKKEPRTIDQTPKQLQDRATDVKRRTGKSVDPNAIGKPVADPHRRPRVLCRTYGPEEWNLIFPDIPSDYGGTVCVRK